MSAFAGAGAGAGDAGPDCLRAWLATKSSRDVDRHARLQFDSAIASASWSTKPGGGGDGGTVEGTLKIAGHGERNAKKKAVIKYKYECAHTRGAAPATAAPAIAATDDPP